MKTLNVSPDRRNSAYRAQNVKVQVVPMSDQFLTGQVSFTTENAESVGGLVAAFSHRGFLEFVARSLDLITDECLKNQDVMETQRIAKDLHTLAKGFPEKLSPMTMPLPKKDRR